MEPGSSKGMIEAQYLMRSATQSNLSSFHVAGLKREQKIGIQELLDLVDSKNIYTKTKIADEKSFKRKHINRKVSHYVVGYTDLEDGDPDSFWKMDTRGVSLRLYVSYKKMLDDYRDIGLLSEAISTKESCEVRCSSSIVGIIDIVSEEGGHYKIYKILNTDIGTEGIREVSSNRIEGSNLLEVLAETKDKETYCNKVKDVEKVLGIEAARWILINEMGEDFGTIADFMTWHGRIKAFTKFSPDMSSEKILRSLAFERPGNELKKLDGKKDFLKSTYSEIIMGINPSIGTESSQFEILEIS